MSLPFFHPLFKIDSIIISHEQQSLKHISVKISETFLEAFHFSQDVSVFPLANRHNLCYNTLITAYRFQGELAPDMALDGRYGEKPQREGILHP